VADNISFTHNKSIISLYSLNSKVFNPFELNDMQDVDNLLPTAHLDPDAQFFRGSISIYKYGDSDYYTEDSFNSKCSNVGINSQMFSIVHCNIRSLPKNLSEFDLYLLNIKLRFTVIGLTETWLKCSNVDIYSLLGYQHEYIIRKPLEMVEVFPFLRPLCKV
jgi:hypothetical protein